MGSNAYHLVLGLLEHCERNALGAHYLRDTIQTVLHLLEPQPPNTNDHHLLLHYLDDNCHHDCSRDGIAKLFNCHPNHLNRICRQHSGLSFQNYLQQARMRRAKELLGRSTMTIHDISKACGFDSHQGFSRRFRKHVGCTPLEWRNQQL